MNPTTPPPNPPGPAPSPAPAPYPYPAAAPAPYPAPATPYPAPTPASDPTAAPVARPQTYPPQAPWQQPPTAPSSGRPFVAARIGAGGLFGGDRPRWLLAAGIAALALVLILAVIIVRALGAPTLTADWSGKASVGGARGQNAGVYLNLAQNGQQLTGVGEGCTLQGSTGKLVKVDLYTVTGAFDGSNVTMDWTPIGQGLAKPAVLHVTGRFTSGQLSLTAKGPFNTMNMVLQKAPFSDFTGTCQALAS